jgi:hypothetical protein
LSDRWQLPVFSLFALFMVGPFLTCPPLLGPVTRSFTATVFDVVYYPDYDTSSIFTYGHDYYKFLGDMRGVVQPGFTYTFTVERQQSGAWLILELEEIYR